MKLLYAAWLVVLACAAPAAGQALSEDELLRRFEAQKELFLRAQQGDVDATRGIELFSIEDLAPGASGTARSIVSPVATGTGLQPLSGMATVTGVPSPDTRGATQGQPPARVVVASLAPDLQVNINIRFAFDSATINADQRPVLDRMCEVMKRSDVRLFRIIGHTDAVGSDDYNRRLSQLRAEEVRRRLVDDCGILPGRLEAIGLGKSLLANESDPAGAENRRVEFQALS